MFGTASAPKHEAIRGFGVDCPIDYRRTPFFHPVKLMSESKSVIGLSMKTLWNAKRSLEEYVKPLRG